MKKLASLVRVRNACLFFKEKYRVTGAFQQADAHQREQLSNFL